MSAPIRVLSCLILAVLIASVTAEPPRAIDLIPEDAAIALAIRKPAELRKKGDRVFPAFPFGMTFSQIMDKGIQELDLKWKIDETKPASVVLTIGKLGGFDNEDKPLEEWNIGTILTPASFEEMAKAYSVPVAELKKEHVRKVPGVDRYDHLGTEQAGFRNGYVYLTRSEKATKAMMKNPTPRSALPAALQRRLDEADAVVYAGPPAFRFLHKYVEPANVENAVNPGLEPQEKETENRFIRAMREANYGVAGVRLDDGLGVDLTIGFDPKGPASQALLKSFARPDRTSNLTGLPDSERFVAGFSAIGLDKADFLLARTIAANLWFGVRGPVPLLESNSFMTKRIFGDLYSQLRLGKAALYQTSNPTKHGQMALVLILEPNDAGKFIKNLSQYVRLGDVAQFDPKAPASQAEIARLVDDLGSEDYETRETASTRLAVIGEYALPALEKAAKSSDAEVRGRADRLRQALTDAADVRKRELTKGLDKNAFRPSFTLKLNAEKIGSTDVHLLGVKLEGADKTFLAALKDYLGPQWDRVRLAVVDKQLVVLLGSDTTLLEETIRNLRDGKPGLEQAKVLANFHKQAGTDRRVELHLCFSRLRVLFTPASELPKDFKVSDICSSAALRTGKSDAGIAFWVSARDLREWFFR